MTTAVYAGTFDPVTFGHLDIIVRAEAIYKKLIVTTTENTSKHSLFNLEERISLLEHVLSDNPGAEVKPFHGLLVDFARSVGAKVMIRGLRAAGDFEYEFQMAMMNRNLAPDIETVFLVTSPQYMFVSSSLIREVAHAGGDLSQFVPNVIKNAIITKLGRSLTDV